MGQCNYKGLCEREAGRQAERREDADSFEDGVWPHEPGTGSL